MTHVTDDPLPIDAVLPEIKAALRERATAVVVAPPGAGKTTRVPLALLDEPWLGDRKILLLEPRRLAARAAASRMAAQFGERIGERIGLRIRFGSQTSRQNRIEVVTEGVFTRLLLADPELKQVGAILFDEFHERSLDADLGLALALDLRALRDDLRILVMSATLDAAAVAKLIGDAPVIEGKGRAFPVETRHLGREPRAPIERQLAGAVMRALADESGSILVFLPGAGEIRRTAELLAAQVTEPSVDLVPLYGALDADTQDRAIAPAPPGRRKVVLATSIAETSLTIEGVRVVIDSGLMRVPRYEPAVGLTRLETVRVSRTSADQRRGRAGRTEPGVCYRLWDEPETRSLVPFAAPEIRAADLSPLLLDLAAWGVRDPGALAWLDPPPSAALAEARKLLAELGALDDAGAITPLGRRLAELPLPPRLAAMIVQAGEEGTALLAAEIAALVSERGLGGPAVDLSQRIEAFRRDRSRRGEEARRLARRWAETAGGALEESDPTGAGALLALAFPDRLAKARPGKAGGFVLANGRGAMLDPAEPLARAPYLAVAELAGGATEARILSAARIEEEEIVSRFADRIETATEVQFDPASAALKGRALRRFGGLTLSEHPVPVATSEATDRLLTQGVVGVGLERLPWTEASRQWLARVRFLARQGSDWPDLSEATLVARASEWLAPALAGKTALAELKPDALLRALGRLLPSELSRRLEREAPAVLAVPTGSSIMIDYSGAAPRVAVRVQELFGLDRHPLAGTVPIVLDLLSPAGRPIQVTSDLPSFWRGSWAEVRRAMRGRYPKHAWPEDPTRAMPTRRAKPRGVRRP